MGIGLMSMLGIVKTLSILRGQGEKLFYFINSFVLGIIFIRQAILIVEEMGRSALL